MPNNLCLYKNQYKKPGDNRPDYRVHIYIEQPLEPGEYEVGAYNKISKAGNPYTGGLIVPKLKEEKKPVEHWQEREKKAEPIKKFNAREFVDSAIAEQEDSEIPF